MGSGITQVAAIAGMNVMLCDTSALAIQASTEGLALSLANLVAQDKLSAAAADAATLRVVRSTDIQASARSPCSLAVRLHVVLHSPTHASHVYTMWYLVIMFAILSHGCSYQAIPLRKVHAYHSLHSLQACQLSVSLACNCLSLSVPIVRDHSCIPCSQKLP